MLRLKRHRFAWLAAIAALAIALGLAACGGEGDEGSDSESEASSEEPAAPEEIPEGAVAAVSEAEENIVSQSEFDEAAADAVLALAPAGKVVKEATADGSLSPSELDDIAAEQTAPPALPPGTEDEDEVVDEDEIVDPDQAWRDAVNEQALNAVLLPIWLQGESADREIDATDVEVDARAQEEIDANFGSDKEFEKFALGDGDLCEEYELAAGDAIDCDGVQDAVSQLIIQEKLIEDIGAVDASDTEAFTEYADAIPDEEVEQYYEDNPDQFTEPLTSSEAQVRTALATEQVEEITAEFEEELISKWRALTLCVEPTYAFERCSNGPEPEPDEESEVMEDETAPETAPSVEGF